MISDILRLLFKTLLFLPPFAITAISHRITTILHAHTYAPLPSTSTKTVLVIGGSFAGFQVAKRLTQTLPTGYRVILIEKNSHLNYVFSFPRFSVVKGFEEYAFIPYDGLKDGAPEGIFEHVRGRVLGVDGEGVWIEGGQRLGYEFLVVATGTASGLPGKVAAGDSVDAQGELRGMQERIGQAGRIAVIGGGAVGVELACDIKDFHPEKEVVLFHSRAQLLPSFGMRLHSVVLARMEELGVKVVLEERPVAEEGGKRLKLGSGEEMAFDLIIPCTGQRPNSEILSALSPASISKQTSHVLVQPTLQIADERFPHVFACGDVAATGGPKMGRAGLFQSEVLVHNIIALIQGKKNLKTYKPLKWIEGSIKLTLGKTRIVIYTQEDSGEEILIPLNMGKEDMEVKKAWRMFGADVGAVGKRTDVGSV